MAGHTDGHRENSIPHPPTHTQTQFAWGEGIRVFKRTPSSLTEHKIAGYLNEDKNYKCIHICIFIGLYKLLHIKPRIIVVDRVVC